jgi:hypothetical protein
MLHKRILTAILAIAGYCCLGVGQSCPPKKLSSGQPAPQDWCQPHREVQVPGLGYPPSLPPPELPQIAPVQIPSVSNVCYVTQYSFCSLNQFTPPGTPCYCIDPRTGVPYSGTVW